MLTKIGNILNWKKGSAAVLDFPASLGGRKVAAPEPLPHTEPHPADYPVQALPAQLRRVVEAIAAMTQAPAAIAAQSALAVVSLCYAGRTHVETSRLARASHELFLTDCEIRRAEECSRQARDGRRECAHRGASFGT